MRSLRFPPGLARFVAHFLPRSELPQALLARQPRTLPANNVHFPRSARQQPTLRTVALIAPLFRALVLRGGGSTTPLIRPRWRSKTRSTASRQLESKCHLSATCVASGAP